MDTTASNQRDPPSKFLITGGCGYVGFHIGKWLVEHGHQVTLYDLKYPLSQWDPTITTAPYCSSVERLVSSSGIFFYRKGDVRDADCLAAATKDIDCVIHTAAMGLSGREQLATYRVLTEQVNILGTDRVIEACARNHVRALVYTSTYNVVFGGQNVFNGDESLPYFPLSDHVDHYSRTKAIAEKMVLSRNGESGLRTCALRLAGVMGPAEPRHLPRIVDSLRKGLLLFDFGDQHGAIVDFIGVENVVQAHVKAAFKLMQPDSSIGGEAFFVSDGQPINNLEYFRPLIEHFGCSFPTRRLPLWLLTVLVWLVHLISVLIARWIPFTPFLTPAELYKTSVTHYFSIDKARTKLGYRPVKPNDLSGVIEYYSKSDFDKGR